MPSLLTERTFCLGLFFFIIFLVAHYSVDASSKADRCNCDWGQSFPPGATRCHPLNTAGDALFTNSPQQYCDLIHGEHDGFCIIDIFVNVDDNIWQLLPHCENVVGDGLVSHCEDDSPFSAFNSHTGPIHSFQYCCTTSDFCNNRSLIDIQRQMCEPSMRSKIKEKWAGSSPIKVDQICAALDAIANESLNVTLIVAVVAIVVVIAAVSLLALCSWNKIVKYKLEYDRACRQRETELRRRSSSSSPVTISQSNHLVNGGRRRNGWLVAVSTFLARRRSRNTNNTSTMTMETPLASRNGESFLNGNGHIYKANGGCKRFSKPYPIQPVGIRQSPSNFDSSSTVQTGSSFLPTGTNSMNPSQSNGRSQQQMQQPMLDEFSTSGSGAGRPLLGTRTVARQIKLGQLVGKGRYGEVHAGSWVNGRVAVKVFPSREQQSWAREIEIYNSLTMRHENVLAFVAADSKDTGLTTELWLVTAFHSRGSLYDFLLSQSIPLRIALRLAKGIASGMAHLHMEIPGNQGKPAIAHRDLKSKNILVTNQLSACIADFGLAVKYTASTRMLDIPVNLRVGTRRYMAPELLDRSFHTGSFDSYISADLYALGLVMWEILSRCHLHDKAPADPYMLPYQSLVPPDPSDEDMLEVVCRRNERPVIPKRFSNPDSDCCSTHRRIVTALGQLAVELWDNDPTVRNSALHMKKIVVTARKQLHELANHTELCPRAAEIDPPRVNGGYSGFLKSASVASSAQPLLQTSSMELSENSIDSFDSDNDDEDDVGVEPSPSV